MTTVRTAAEVRAAERPLLEAGEPLMLRAAAAVAAEVRAFAPRRVLVLAGSGNNGGDALFAAAELAAGGAAVDVWPLGRRIHEAGLAAARQAGASLVDAPAGADVVIDGLLGIGADPPLRGPARDAVLAVRAVDPRASVAVDLPSGVHPDEGSADDAVLPADVTVTFGAVKPGLMLEPGRTLAGRIVLVDFGLVFTGELETDRLRLRPWRVDDAGLQRRLWSERDPRVPPHRRIGADGRPSVADLEARIRGADPAAPLQLLAVERKDTGAAIGYCGLVANERLPAGEPELAFELLRAEWGNGYATEASRAVIRWAHAHGYRRLWASVRQWNAASRRVLAKLGFEQTERVEADPIHGASLFTILEYPKRYMV